jgi:LSD1 subclass zinc finger protein
MNLETVTCNNCGAPLQVPAGARFVMCAHCQMRLEVHRDASVVYTEKVSEIAGNTHRMAADLAELRHDNDLDRLDRQWDQERRQFLIRGQNGELAEPSVAGSVIGGIALAAFSVFWISIASRISGPMAMFGIVFLIAGLAMSVVSAGGARAMNAAIQRHRRERDELTQSGAGTTDNSAGIGPRRPPPSLDQFLKRTQQGTQSETTPQS